VIPTVRCAWLVAALALAALLVPLWLVGLAALGVIAATVVDGLAVRRSPRIERNLSMVLARGTASALDVVALTGDERRVLLRQPATPWCEVRTRAGLRELRGEVLAVRRGRHELPAVAAASIGPLGLARWYHRSGAPSELLVYPDLPTAMRLAMHLRQGRAAPDGRLRRGPIGIGTDFESIREYAPDDDIRHVNWRAGARLGRPMTNQYRVEQDRDVVFLVDAGRLMAAPTAATYGSPTLLDAALDAATAVAMAADELGDHCGAIAFDAGIRRELAPRRRGGQRVVHALFDLEPALEDSDFERAFLRVGSSRRALVLVFTDLIDERAADSLLRAAPMLARRHAVVVAGVGDPMLDELAWGTHGSARAPADAVGADAAAVGALSVLEAREGAALSIRRTGAATVLAPSAELPQRCVQAYLRAKAMVRL
jgi:uncharacterized protein (DUF58 family)